MQNYQVNPIGIVRVSEEGIFLDLKPEYIVGLKALEGFRHLNVVWWFSDFDTAEARSVLEAEKPYTNGPEVMGIFATRSPLRPNPIALTTVEILDIDHQKGRISIAYIDAHDGSPVLDLKPYTPSYDRVKEPGAPDWCSHWPDCLEESGDFDWEREFRF